MLETRKISLKLKGFTNGSMSWLAYLAKQLKTRNALVISNHAYSPRNDTWQSILYNKGQNSFTKVCGVEVGGVGTTVGCGVGTTVGCGVGTT